MVPNSNTLLKLFWENIAGSVLDLQNAFFCIPIAEESQQLFAFEWQDPETESPIVLLDSPASRT